MTQIKTRLGGAWVNSTKVAKARIGGAWVDFGPSGGGTRETIWQGEVPAGGRDEAEGGNFITLGTRVIPAVNGTCVDIGFRFSINNPSVSVPVKAGLMRDSDMSLLGETTFPLFPGVALDAWNYVTLPVPIAMVAGQGYTPCVVTPRYCFEAAYPWPRASSPGAHFTTGGGGSGRFSTSYGSGFIYPTGNFNSNCYFVDMGFIPS